ncbi:class I glutamine amidotransferase-like protein [Plenodomus tracheiphilus IPT5]|uniref:Class I glutamine amidotransferase-like protein n=1 Tax=Plenodomus tracheiphilus IPT5 TaxID=1408161 RepID=A0A6A7BJZ8_9PLEO|nr:class I glutamine amidotransferase-like protein [Plenodomus tracheiphilus IPT5]
MLASKVLRAVFLWPLVSLSSTYGQNLTQQQAINRNRTLSIGYVIFDGFEPLDVWGPMEWLTSLSAFYPMNLSTISYHAGPVSARFASHLGTSYDQTINPSMLATHNFTFAPPLDIIIVPGGTGVINATLSNLTTIESFLTSRYDATDYILGVSFGVTHLARSGLLKGKKATTNKSGWAWITGFGQDVKWVPQARWVVDGKVWTSSGMASSLDMVYAWLGEVYGNAGGVNLMTDVIEYAPHLNPDWDPYAVYHQVPGADASRPVLDCVGPVGMTGNGSVSARKKI